MKKLILLFILTFSLNMSAEEKQDNFQKTDEVLSEVVKKALVIAEKTGDFAIEQAPLLLQEFYNWHIYSNIFGILLGLLICFMGYKLPFIWVSEEEKSYMNDVKYFNRFGEEGAIFGWIVFLVSLMVGTAFVFCSLYDLVYILVAPKLYLIDYFIK